ncbi:hypothetical protein QQ045_022700 [Rhodiola kirilowii]
MDWFSWLSKTGLELTLVYDYGVVFACNELTAEDIAYFDHEILQSMGINVAKHRLEIIKLARSEAAVRVSKSGVSGLVLEVIGRTKRRVVECAKKMMMLQGSSSKMGVKKGGAGHEGREEVFMLTNQSHNGQWDDKGRNEGCKGCRSPMKSGPLERNGKPRVVRRGHSGPLSHPERSGCNKSPVAPRSPKVSTGPNDGVDSLWAKLFQDMKPT